MPSARAVGTGTARGHARSRSWPSSTPGLDELMPLPAKGPRAATPEDGAAALVAMGAAPGLAGDALVTLSCLASPSSLQQAISHGQQDQTPQGPLPAPPCLLAAWLPPLSQPALSSTSQPKKQARAFLESLGKPGTATRQPQPQPVLVTPAQLCRTLQPGHPEAQGSWHLPACFPPVLPLAWPGRFSGAWMPETGLTALPGVRAAHAGEPAAPHRAGVLQESTISPVPGWFYSLQGWDNGRKSPERGMRPGLGTKRPET